ncbi:MAG TPA: Mov34/MPN/PAD-1 family protein [Planctomycetaceae bacterium]|nr:Mov34/MPN/PAD-1 family protein [Planctomycetaceae bacterium]
MQFCEECWLLVGRRRGRLWYARRIGRCRGQPASVEFDGPAVLDREERKRDVIGFLHTHPASEATPSRRDLATMRAWVSAFGKPLLCVIEGTNGLAAYRFDDDESTGEPLLSVEVFPRGVVIGVDADGG